MYFKLISPICSVDGGPETKKMRMIMRKNVAALPLSHQKHASGSTVLPHVSNFISCVSMLSMVPKNQEEG